MDTKQKYFSGVKAGIPIGLGYFAVAFALGITAAEAGLTAAQATLTSLLCNASAGEYAAFSVFAAAGGFFELILMEIVANARYFLMSCTMSQRFSPETSLIKRLAVGFILTDEIFAVNINLPEDISPVRTLGAATPAVPGWALGTLLGVVAGNILPESAVSALSVGLFGMFLAIIIPPCKENKAIAFAVAASFALSSAAAFIPAIGDIPSGIKTVALTVIVSVAAAILFPIKFKTDIVKE